MSQTINYQDPFDTSGLAGDIWMSLVPGAYEKRVGKNQTASAEDAMSKLGERPQYETPESVKAATGISQRMAQSGLPDAQLENYQRGADRNLATTLDAAIGSGSGMNSVQGAYQNSLDAYTDILSMDAGARLQNKRAYVNQLNVQAEDERTAFQLNELAPWQEQLASIQAMQGAGMQNKASGVQAGREFAGDLLSAGAQMAISPASLLMGGGGPAMSLINGATGSTNNDLIGPTAPAGW